MRYTSKPTEVEAVQWVGDNADEVDAFVGPYKTAVEPDRSPPKLWLLAGQDGEQGWVPVPVDNYVVRRVGVLNDHWPVAPGYFEDKYEPTATELPWQPTTTG